MANKQVPALATPAPANRPPYLLIEEIRVHAHALRLSHAVAWVHPVDDVAACVAWLKAGASVSNARCVPASL